MRRACGVKLGDALQVAEGTAERQVWSYAVLQACARVGVDDACRISQYIDQSISWRVVRKPFANRGKHCWLGVAVDVVTDAQAVEIIVVSL